MRFPPDVGYRIVTVLGRGPNVKYKCNHHRTCVSRAGCLWPPVLTPPDQWLRTIAGDISPSASTETLPSPHMNDLGNFQLLPTLKCSVLTVLSLIKCFVPTVLFLISSSYLWILWNLQAERIECKLCYSCMFEYAFCIESRYTRNSARDVFLDGFLVWHRIREIFCFQESRKISRCWYPCWYPRTLSLHGYVSMLQVRTNVK